MTGHVPIGVETPRPLTPAVLYSLLALVGGASHGHTIAHAVEEGTDGRVRMGPGTLYGSLQRMLGDGVFRETENSGEEDLHGVAALRAETVRLERAVDLARGRLQR